MAYEIIVQNITLPAGANLSENQYFAVTVDSESNAVLAGAGEVAIGILQNDPNEDEAATIMTYGLTKAVFGDTVANGAIVTPDADGKLVTSTTGDREVGIAIEGGAADEIGTVLLKSFAVTPA